MTTSAEPRLVTAVDFVCVPTQDFARASTFYADVLGLERSITWGDMPAGEFEAGGVTLALMQVDAFGQEFRPNVAPIALRVEDVAAARAELEAKGVRFVTQFDSGVCHQAIFTDPDGNPLILHHRYAPRPA
jgi:catechol 2,3-dioxygenase-like lactoylglutathione lyase family enzyme